MKNKSGTLLLIILLFSVVPGQSQNRIEFLTYSFLIPDKWVQISETETIKETIRLKTEFDITLPKFDFALRKIDSKNTFDRPFIIIRTNDDGKISPEVLTGLLQIDFKTLKNVIQNNLPSQIKTITTLDSVVDRYYDRKNKIIYTIFKGTRQSVGNTNHAEAWILTNTGYIQVIGSFLEDHFSNEFEDFLKLSNSIHVKDRYKTNINFILKNPAYRGYLTAFIIIIVIILISVFNKRFSKKTN
jgi:hypothetical protein